MFRQGSYTHHVPADGRAATAAADGTATITYGPVPEGYCWYVERISTHCPTATADCHTLVMQTNNPGSVIDYGSRMDFTTAAGDDIADEVNPIFVGPGYYIHHYFVSATSGDAITVAMQYSVHQLDRRDYTQPAETQAQQQEYQDRRPTDGLPVVPTDPYRAV